MFIKVLLKNVYSEAGEMAQQLFAALSETLNLIPSTHKLKPQNSSLMEVSLYKDSMHMHIPTHRHIRKNKDDLKCIFGCTNLKSGGRWVTEFENSQGLSLKTNKPYIYISYITYHMSYIIDISLRAEVYTIHCFSKVLRSQRKTHTPALDRRGRHYSTRRHSNIGFCH